MFKTILKTIGVTLLIAYLAIAGFVWNIGEPPRVYRGLVIAISDSTEAQFIDEREIRQLVLHTDSLNPKGKLVDDYSTAKLQKVLLQNPLISQADCYPTPDTMLRVDIYQRHPILRIKSIDLERDYYVDTEGNLMAYRPSRKAINVPLATGHISKQMATSSLFELVNFINDDSALRKKFTQIYVEKNGDVCLVPRVGDHTIMLGPVCDLEAKFKRLDKFESKVLKHKGWNSYKTINLKFKGQVVAERKE